MLPHGIPLTFGLVLSVLGYQLVLVPLRRVRALLARLTAPSKLQRPPARWEG
jgi:hypothetical protein